LLVVGAVLVIGNTTMWITLAALAVGGATIVASADWRAATLIGTVIGIGAVAAAMWQMASAYPAGAFDMRANEWAGLLVAIGALSFAAAVTAMPPRRWGRVIVALLLLGPTAWLTASGLSNHYRSVKRASQYVVMRDGIRIATDYYLPRGLPKNVKLPTIMSTSRYQRYTRYRLPFNLVLGGPQGSMRRRYIENGYALVTIDARGTGASFGVRDREFGTPERNDGPQIVDWIIRQPWSNGAVGSEGISYGGTAAEYLALSGHPAVKAVAVNFALYDTYLDILSPGGILNEGFVKQWSRMNRMLDTGVLDPDVAPFMARLAWAGVMPVDADRDGALLRQALAQRTENYDIASSLAGRRYRDEMEDPSVRGSIVSPYMFQAAARTAGVPTLMITGWFDGGYQHAAIKRWLTVGSAGSRLVIGPWDHGAFSAISPCNEASASDSRAEWWKERMSFFDHHLKGIKNGERREPRVKYYEMCGDGWQQASDWPLPRTSRKVMYLQPDRTLAPSSPKTASAIGYAGDPASTTGPGSRWMSLAQNLLDPFPIGYPQRAEQDKHNLLFESLPLPAHTDVTGHPIVELNLATDKGQALLFVYLEDVAPDGSVSYVSEGQLDLTNRRTADVPFYKDAVVQHSFRSEDARPMQPGVAERIEIALLPTSFRFRKGHRIRVSFAGADRGNFQQVKGPMPNYRFILETEDPARLILPVERP
jgi:hypothetical protein